MSLKQQSNAGYSQVPQGGNPRQSEAWALIESARRMKEAQADAGDQAALLGAARLNWRLWTLFQASLALPESAVPEEVRNNMLSLANFVDRHTVGFLADPKPEKLDILIRINREIASGLMAQAPKPAEETKVEAPIAKGQAGRVSQSV
jgi:flagellar biosynthesis activator protein FlaF